MIENRSFSGRLLMDDETLWFPAHMSTGDNFLKVTRPGGAPGPVQDSAEDLGVGSDSPTPDGSGLVDNGNEDDGIGLPARKPTRRKGGRKPPRGGGIKATSWLWITLWGAAAVGIVVVAARKEIAAEMTQNWLKGQGVAAHVKFDTFSLSHASGTLLVGEAAHPDVNIEHFDANFGLNLFAGQGQPLARLKTLHANHPLVAISYKNGKLGFGSLDKLVQDSLNAPATDTPPPSEIVLEDATILVDTDYGRLRGRGGIAMHDGQLTWLNLTLPQVQLNGPLGAGELTGGQITAKAVSDAGHGNQLEIHSTLSAASWDARAGQDNPLESAGDARHDLHVQGLTLALDGRVPYRKGIAGLTAFSGPLQGTVAVKAEGVQSQLAYINGLEANLRLDGALKSDKESSQYEGSARLLSRAESLSSGTMDSHNLRLDGPALGLRARFGAKDGVSLAVGGTLSGDVGALSQGDVFVKAAHLHIDALSMTADASGSNTDFKGGLDVSRAAAADLSLETAKIAFSGDAHSDASTGQWSVNLNNDIRSDYGQYLGLKAMADANRRTPPPPGAPKDGPKDGIIALDRAFQRFSLRVKGLKVALMGQGAAAPQYDVRLHGSAAADLNGGGHVTLTPQPLKPLLSTGETGGFAVALTGPDLPQVALTVTKLGYPDPRNPFVLSGDYALTSQFSTAPVTGAKLDAHGQFASTNTDGFNATLDVPVAVTIQSAELGDHIEHLTANVAQRDGAIFRATPQGWRVTGIYSDLALTAPNEGLRLGGAQGRFDVFSQAGSDTPGLKMAMNAAELSDTTPAEQRRFKPLHLTGTLDQDTRSLTGRFTASATPPKTGKSVAIAAINLDNDILSGKGSLSFKTLNLTFDPAGLQPTTLSPQVEAVMSRGTTGTASFTGAFNWDGAKAWSGGVLKLDGLNFRGAMGAAQGLAGEIDFTSLAPLTTKPGQTIRLKHLQAAVPLDDFALSVQFKGDHISVESADVMTPGGKIQLEPTNVPLDGRSPIDGALSFNGLDFGKVIAASGLAQNMTFKGDLTGRVPFTIIGGHITFAQGLVTADAPGQISVKRSGVTDVTATGSLSSSNGAAAGTADTAFNPFQDLAFQAMEHISYDKLDAKINSLPDGRIDVNFHIKGRFDPPQKQKATISFGDYVSGKWMTKPIKLPSDTPVELFLDMPLSLPTSFTDLGNGNIVDATVPK